MHGSVPRLPLLHCTALHCTGSKFSNGVDSDWTRIGNQGSYCNITFTLSCQEAEILRHWWGSLIIDQSWSWRKGLGKFAMATINVGIASCRIYPGFVPSKGRQTDDMCLPTSDSLADQGSPTCVSLSHHRVWFGCSDSVAPV